MLQTSCGKRSTKISGQPWITDRSSCERSSRKRSELSVERQCAAFEMMTASGPCADTPDAFNYSAQVSATRPASDYTARIVPHHPNALVPLEASQIVWQR